LDERSGLRSSFESHGLFLDLVGHFLVAKDPVEFRGGLIRLLDSQKSAMTVLARRAFRSRGLIFPAAASFFQLSIVAAGSSVRSS